MKSKVNILLIGALLFVTNAMFSQGCEAELPGASNDSLSGPSINIFGYIQPQYDYSFTDGDQANTFRFKRARIGARGKVMNNFSYYFMLETSPFIGSTGDAYLMDAFVTYEASNWARISLGSFKQPFSLDVQTPCNDLPTIERSMVADQLVAPQRDLGLAVFGGNKFNRLNYAVALMNGRGLGVKDDNEKKDVMGRVSYKVLRNLTIGASLRYGYPIPNNNDQDRTSYGGDFVFELGKFLLQGEYIYDEGAYFAGAGGGCGVTPVALGEEREGAYILGTYDVSEKFQPVIKYEFFDPDSTIKDNIGYSERMTVGFNYFVNSNVRFQVNYLANIETVASVNNDALLTQVQVKF